ASLIGSALSSGASSSRTEANTSSRVCRGSGDSTRSPRNDIESAQRTAGEPGARREQPRSTLTHNRASHITGSADPTRTYRHVWVRVLTGTGILSWPIACVCRDFETRHRRRATDRRRRWALLLRGSQFSPATGSNSSALSPLLE